MINNRVFMIMPFSDESARGNYEANVKQICNDHKLVVKRADEIFGVKPFYDDIVKEILEANILIVDVTSKNANVFYELGIAHTVKPDRTIIITQDDYKDVPNDIAHFRIIKYGDTNAESVIFKEILSKTINNMLSDGAETFKYEFEFTYDLLSDSKKQNILIGIIGLSKYDNVVKSSEPIYFEGYYPSGKTEHHSLKATDLFKSMATIKNVKFDNGVVVITEKGKLFAQYLQSIGLGCGIFQGITIEEDYIPIVKS